MVDYDAQTVSWILVTVQLAGLSSAWLARLSEGSRGQTSCQRIFLACLGLVGVATVLSLFMTAGTWMFSGATLSLMVLAAVWDFGGSTRAEAA